MDSGIFLSSKKRMLFWALAPSLFLAILYFLFFNYFKSINSVLSEQKSSVALMPVMIQKVSIADELLGHYKSATTKTEVIELLNSELNKMAQQSNFIINSLTVQKKDEKDTGKTIVFKMGIKGEGSLGAILSFFNKIQFSERLFTVEAANIKASPSTLGSVYTVNYIFLYYTLQ